MLSFFRPNLYINSVFDLAPEALAAKGIRGLIMDLDNTLLAWGEHELPEALHAWMARMRCGGLEACIVSNNTRKRVERLGGILGVVSVFDARKPRRRGFRRAMEMMGTLPSETAVVGDQLFTDIFGGNRLGLYTVLVAPVSPKEFFGTRIVRVVERQVLERLGI